MATPSVQRAVAGEGRARGARRGALAAVAAALIAAILGPGLTPSVPSAFATPSTPPAPPTPSATDLEIDAGYAGRNFVPGHVVPVRVRITADRLVAGDLRVEAHTLGGAATPVVVPVEVPGGSTKDVLVAIPTSYGADRLQVTARFGGDGPDVVAGESELTYTGSTELVGLLPGLVDQVPPQVQMPMGLGTARFANLDAELAVPGALDPLGTIVTGPGGLGDLDETARHNVLDWVDRGGRLVVDTDPGDRIGGLPTEWQPGDAPRMAVGRGEVRFSGGAATEGRWAEVVEPTPLVQPGEVLLQMGFASGDVGTAVARDGGFQIPTLGWLLVFLVVYVVLAGPVAFFVVRRRGVLWSWAALPVLAVVFAGVAFVVGNDARRGSQSAHGTAVETSPAGARAYSYVGLVSRTGADGHARFPAGWSVTDVSGAWTDFGPMPVPLPAGRDGGLIAEGSRSGSETARITADAEGTSGEVELDPGDFGLLRGWGPLDADTPGLEVSATAAADGSLRGTVRNTTDVTLREVLVMVGMRPWDGGTLEPGQEVEWQLAPEEGVGMMGDLPEQPWREASGWDEPPEPGHPVNYELWADLQSQLVDPYAPGWVTAAGWTADWSPPIDPGGDLEAGRTVFTTRAPVTADDGAVPQEAVRREVVRGGRATDVPQPADAAGGADDKEDEPGFGGDEWGPTNGAVVRFALPDGADPDARLEVSLPGAVRVAEVWDGDRWAPLQEPADRPDDIQDPFDPRADRSLPLPAGAVQDGAVYLRVAVLQDVVEPGMNFTVEEATT